mgnify:CR=1 FL=1
MPKPQPTSLRLDPEIKRRLLAYAKPRGWPLGQLITYVLKEWVEYQQKLEKKK